MSQWAEVPLTTVERGKERFIIRWGGMGRNKEFNFGMTCRERHSHQQACVSGTMRSLFIQSFIHLIIHLINKYPSNA